MLDKNPLLEIKNFSFTLVAFIGLFCSAFGQDLTGATTVDVNTSHIYTFDDGTLHSPTWSVVGGTTSIGTQPGRGSTEYTMSVNWTTGPSGSITFNDFGTPLETLNVTINGSGGGNPGGGTNVGTNTNLSDRNYVHTVSPRIATTDVSTLDNDEKIESVTYFDGLGRAEQSIAIRAGGLEEDIVTYLEYDPFGRQQKEYLPYSIGNDSGAYNTDALTGTTGHYGIPKYDNTANPFSEKDFETSPLNRVLKQAAPGYDWRMGGGHEIEMAYLTNGGSEVRYFSVNLTPNTANNVKTYMPGLSLNGYYNAGELYKSVTKDENHDGSSTKAHTTEEFKDAEGRVILKRTYGTSIVGGSSQTNVEHETYYVYDIYGNLTYVIPPKVDLSNNAVDPAELSELCYQYKYDYRNRLVEKKIPGKGWEYIVYDNLDRPVLTQDANQRVPSTDEWLFTKYDALGRVIYTGLFDSNNSRTSLQNTFNNKNTTQNYESKVTSGTGYDGTYYNNAIFPNTGIEILTVNYYDDYSFNTDSQALPSSWGGQTIINYNNATSTKKLTKSLVTGSRIKVLGESDWITNVTGYDVKGRPIYIMSKNSYLGTSDIVKNTLDFVGSVDKTITEHDKGITSVDTEDLYTYDHVGRLTKQTQELNNTNIVEVIVENTYDDLGQLESKSVGGKTNQSRLQDVEYTYNVRGWLKQINDPTALGTDLFAFKINYNTKEIGGSTAYKNLYNGNISEVVWKTANDISGNKTRGYAYAYDALNRLIESEYAIKTTGSFSIYQGYDEKIPNYDKNGNIFNLVRYKTPGALMDNLVYEYSGNKLMKVIDNSTSNIKDEGFKDGTNSGNDYTYDTNGNMLRDYNKGIASNISYNHLNLPTQVNLSGGNIQYIYDATGLKLKKIISTGTNTEYAGNHIYENGTLKFFSHPEGYVEPDGSGGFDYVYQYKDHLGNVRLSYADSDGNGSIDASTEIISEKNYYPFGLEHKGYNNVVNGVENNFQTYNGVEKEESLGFNVYEMPMRFFDPAIARWNRPDPITHFETSPYNGMDNNPIKGSDPTGADVIEIEGGYKFTGEDAQNAFAAIQSALSGPGDKDKKKKKRNSTPDKAPTTGSKYSLMGAGYAYAYSQNAYQYSAAMQGRDSLTEEEMDEIDSDTGWAMVDLFTLGSTRAPKALGWLYKALFASSKFSKLKYAGKYGFDSYNKLKKLTAGKGVEVHHLLEQRFAKTLGLKPGQMKSIVLSPSEHQAFTNAWRKAIPYSNSNSAINTATATAQQIQQAAQQIYKSYPEILKQLK